MTRKRSTSNARCMDVPRFPYFANVFCMLPNGLIDDVRSACQSGESLRPQRRAALLVDRVVTRADRGANLGTQVPASAVPVLCVRGLQSMRGSRSDARCCSSEALSSSSSSRAPVTASDNRISDRSSCLEKLMGSPPGRLSWSKSSSLKRIPSSEHTFHFDRKHVHFVTTVKAFDTLRHDTCWKCRTLFLVEPLLYCYQAYRIVYYIEQITSKSM